MKENHYEPQLSNDQKTFGLSEQYEQHPIKKLGMEEQGKCLSVESNFQKNGVIVVHFLQRTIPKVIESGLDITYLCTKLASYRFMDGIFASSASTPDSPTQGVALWLNSSMQSFSSVHPIVHYRFSKIHHHFPSPNLAFHSLPFCSQSSHVQEHMTTVTLPPSHLNLPAKPFMPVPTTYS